MLIDKRSALSLVTVKTAGRAGSMRKHRTTALLAGGNCHLFLGLVGSSPSYFRFGMVFDWRWHRSKSSE